MRNGAVEWVRSPDKLLIKIIKKTSSQKSNNILICQSSKFNNTSAQKKCHITDYNTQNFEGFSSQNWKMDIRIKG